MVKCGGVFVLNGFESLDHPIIQAPIGSASSVELVAAVSNAGGMGSLAMTWTGPAIAGKLVAELKRLTDGLFAVNFVLSFEPRSLKAVLDAGAPIITFSWGIDVEKIEFAKRSGALVGVQVGSPGGAVQAIEGGADFLICQGAEAGGHVQSTTSLAELLPQVLTVAEHVPVIAAGGLADSHDVRQVIDAGAAAAMLGTRFVVATESKAHPAYQQALIAAGENATSFTGCYDGGWPYSAHRVLRNYTLDRWEAAGCPQPGRRPGEGDLIARTTQGWDIPRYHVASPVCTTTGNVLELALYAGTGSARIGSILPAKEIVQRLSARNNSAFPYLLTDSPVIGSKMEI